MTSFALGVTKQKKRVRKPDPQGNARLFFDGTCFFIETIRTMSAAAFAAMSSFEVEFFGETFVAFGCEVEIFAFDWDIFFILVEHRAKIEI